MSRIAVIGAGITGVTTAYELNKLGHTVTVFDKHGYAGMETSFANGGQLSASNAEVWNSLPTLFKGLKWMLRPDAPLLFNPTPSWHKYSWMAEFIANIPRHRQHTIQTTRMAITAREHLFAMAKTENIQFDLEHRGILHIYHDNKSFEAARQGNKLLKEGGLFRQAMTPSEIKSLDPAINAYELYGGFFTPSDSTGDIHKFTRGLAVACKAKGVQFLYNANVTKIRHDLDYFFVSFNDVCEVYDKVVICAGVESRRFAADLGDRINIYPVKGYSITVNLDTTSQNKAPWVSLLDESTKIVTSRLGKDRFRVAGTTEFNGFNRDIRADRIAPLVQWTKEQFPDVNTDRVVPWAGLRPMTPTMLPKVGQGNHHGVYYNTGHGHLGWTLSGATAVMLADAVGPA